MKIVCDCLDTETYDSTTSGGSSDSESSSSSSSGSSSGDSSSSSSSDASSSSNENSSSNSSTISGPYIKSITSNTTANNETQLTITTSTGTNVITIPSATITNFSASKTAVGHKLSLALNNATAKTVSLNYDASSVAVSSNVSPINNCQYLNQALDALAKNASGSGSSTKITSFEITSGSLNTDKIYETLPKTTTLTLSWSIYNAPKKVLLCYDDDEIDVTNYTTADITVTATTAGIIDITLACFTEDSDFNDVLIDSKTLSIQVGDPYYYGFSSTAPSSSSTATFIKTLTKHLQLTPETGPIVLDCKNNATKYWSFVSPYKVYILNAGSIVTGLTEHTVSLFLTDTNNGYDNMYIYTFPYKFNNNIVLEIIKA